MHIRSLSELQGSSPQQGASTLRTTKDEAFMRSSRPRRGLPCCLRSPRASPLLVWLLLGALALPGAWSFLTEEMEELLVELHNHYRGQVSPSASAMLPLKWDPSLKLIAEGYAAKCIWHHNPELEETGENLFAGTKTIDLREALEEWFLEHLSYDFHNNSCDEDKMCGHYTQMVWADTHRVGCALHVCNDMEGLNWGKTYFLVCNYYPTGNYEGERPYVEGDVCSRCPENFQKCENNLCGADMEEEDDIDAGDEEEFTDFPTTTVPFQLAQEDKVEETSEEEEIPVEEEYREEEVIVPPPATSDSHAPPASTDTPSTTTTASAGDLEEMQPESTHHSGTQPPQDYPSTQHPQAQPDPQPPQDYPSTQPPKAHPSTRPPQALPDPQLPQDYPSTLPPKAPATTLKRSEEVQDRMEEKIDKKDQKGEMIQPAEKAERDEIGKIFQGIPVTISAASICTSCFLFTCLTAILTMRL